MLDGRDARWPWRVLRRCDVPLSSAGVTSIDATRAASGHEPAAQLTAAAAQTNRYRWGLDRPVERRRSNAQRARGAFAVGRASVGPNALPGSSGMVQRVASLAVLVRIAGRWWRWRWRSSGIDVLLTVGRAPRSSLRG